MSDFALRRSHLRSFYVVHEQIYFLIPFKGFHFIFLRLCVVSFGCIFCALPNSYFWFPGSVYLFSNRIARSGQNNSWLFKWIFGFKWSQESGCHVLNLVNKRGFVRLYVAPDQETRDKIEAADRGWFEEKRRIIESNLRLCVTLGSG